MYQLQALKAGAVNTGRPGVNKHRPTEVALRPVGRSAAATSAAERAANPADRGGRDMAAAALKLVRSRSSSSANQASICTNPLPGTDGWYTPHLQTKFESNAA